MPSRSFCEVRARRKRDIWGWSVEGAWSVVGVETVNWFATHTSFMVPHAAAVARLKAKVSNSNIRRLTNLEVAKRERSLSRLCLVARTLVVPKKPS